MEALLDIERALGRRRRVPRGPAPDRHRHSALWIGVVSTPATGDSASADGGAAIRAGAVGGDRAGCAASCAEEDHCGAAGGHTGSQRSPFVQDKPTKWNAIRAGSASELSEMLPVEQFFLALLASSSSWRSNSAISSSVIW